MSWFQYLWVGLKQTKHSKEQKGTSKLIDNGGGISWSIKKLKSWHSYYICTSNGKWEQCDLIFLVPWCNYS